MAKDLILRLENKYMSKEEITKQLKIRIQNELSYFNNNLPERFSLAWHGYLTGLAEWKVINRDSYDNLIKMLPKISEPDPIETILLGRE